MHRDLKPANIKITPAGVVKVLDFGLAKAGVAETEQDVSQVPTVTVATRAGVLLGTVPYMSPEQARGRVVDKRTAIWAVGCVLYEMLTGKAAFARDSVSDTIAAILERDPDWSALPSTAPPGVTRLLHRCLEKDARRRLRDIADARQDLEDANASESLDKAVVDRTGVQRGVRASWFAMGAVVAALTAAFLGPQGTGPTGTAEVAPASPSL